VLGRAGARAGGRSLCQGAPARPNEFGIQQDNIDSEGGHSVALDVLLITALYDEPQAVLRLGNDPHSEWQTERGQEGLPYHLQTFQLSGEENLHVAAAWSGEMGETAAAVRSQSLIQRLQPAALALCGICAGRRGDVFLGDVIVATRVFSYDHGKLIAGEKEGHRVEDFFHDIETYNLDKAWAMNARYLADEAGWQQVLQTQRPEMQLRLRGADEVCHR
jgi:nucleoside phosphorylase